MRPRFLAAFVAVSLIVSPSPFAWSGGAKERDLNGTWTAASAEIAGKALPEEYRKLIKLTIKDGSYTVNIGKNTDQGTVKRNASAKPMELDIATSPDGPNKGKTILAIYEWDGDNLRICYDLSGKNRPTEFKSAEGTPTFLVAYQREKSTETSAPKYRVYFGTYTGKNSKGVYMSEFNPKDGSLTPPTLAGETSSPSFVAFSPNKKFLYAVNEDKAAISAFAIDEATGKLTYLNTEPSQGGAPCHIIVDPSGKNVLAANYSGGSCICVPIEADGKLGKASSFQQHEGKKKNGHSIHVDKANKFALCCDLGLDKVIIYAFDPAKGTLTPHGAFDTPKGAGPRHFAWHPDGKSAYINGETDLTIIACDYDAEKGTLTQKQVLSTLPKDVVRKGGSTAETVVHPSGKFVYVSNRDPYNSIAIFSIDPKTRELTPVGHQAKGIKTPRNFAIDPTGQYMLVANQSGGDVLVFRIDQSTGELTPTDTRIEVASPVCVRFMEIK